MKFIGQSYDDVVKNYENLSPLFSFIQGEIENESLEWSKEIELTLDDRSRLIYCQGAVLEVEGKNTWLRNYNQ